MRVSDTKPDATGRSSGKPSGRRGQYQKPPKGEAFVWQSRSMMESPAWSALSINGRRILDRLMLEHMSHAGTENGNLIATHQQFREFGVPGNSVRPAVDELEFLGFIRCERGGRWAGKNTPSRYRLTWLGDNRGAAPSNEWQHVSVEQIEAWRKQRRELRKAHRDSTKNQVFPKKSESTVLSLSVVRGGKSDV